MRGGLREGYRPNQLHFDHVKPWASGGDHSFDNLVVSCARCNLGRKKPSINLRTAYTWVEYRYGKYWWPEGYSPPRLVEPDHCSFLLAEVAGPRRPALSIVQRVHRGEVAATGPGEPVCIDMPPTHATPARRGRRR